MLFSSSPFLFLFLPVVVLVYYLPLRRTRMGQNVFLLLASLFFYGYGEQWFVLVMIGSIVLNYLLGLAAHHVREKGVSKGRVLVVLGTCLVNLGIIFVFKYLNFTVENLNALLRTQIVVPYIELPIGISFFTFQSMSYVLDVLRGKGEVQRNPLNVGLYVAFFPQLIAGPIVRYETIAREIKHRKENWADFSSGVCRFIVGLGKKVLLANSLAVVADAVANAGNAGPVTVSYAWLGAIAYVLQLYFDFSGYSDMAIGLGKMFGFHFLENFNFPLIAKSISELWRRWHISLGSWFQDYVYFPLGGSRVSKPRLIWNLFVVWMLTGLWHGANWTFIVWGLYYYVFIALEKATPLKGFLERHRVISSVYTLFLFCIGEFMFRADTVASGWQVISAMLGFGASGLWDMETLFYLGEYKWFFLVGILCATPVFRYLRQRMDERERRLGETGTSRMLDAGYTALLLMLLLVSVSYIVKGTYNPFIYFNF